MITVFDHPVRSCGVKGRHTDWAFRPLQPQHGLDYSKRNSSFLVFLGQSRVMHFHQLPLPSCAWPGGELRRSAASSRRRRPADRRIPSVSEYFGRASSVPRSATTGQAGAAAPLNRGRPIGAYARTHLRRDLRLGALHRPARGLHAREIRHVENAGWASLPASRRRALLCGLNELVLHKDWRPAIRCRGKRQSGYGVGRGCGGDPTPV